jgi:ADP-dependent NAD(P)H-hydrate dehydratase / NAD(P)H-hydrate epimerase
MIPVVTAAGAAAMDERASVPVDVLMDRAGLAVALAAVDLGAAYGRRVTVLCGPGNNGGDGYVAARHLRRRGVGVRVAALAEPTTQAAGLAAGAARRAGVPIGPLGAPSSEDLVIDALFGGGFRRGLPHGVAAWFETPAPVVAVDVPSGVDPDSGEAPDGAFVADATVTFGALKPAHLMGEGPARCGAVSVVDIGLAPADPVLRVVEDADVDLPARPLRAHKWSVGSVLVVGGSRGMVGAAVMAGRAALHFGAGSVGVVSPEQATIAVQAPELLSFGPDRLDAALDRFDVVVVGPGLADDASALQTVLAGAARVVADADALGSAGALAGAAGDLVITPHQGEFTRLTDAPPTHEGARALARELGAVVLLKGWPTIVTDGSTPWAVVSGGPELATIGTGDVLAGMIAAAWARGLDPLPAAYTAAHLHGLTAARLAREGTVTADALAVAIGRSSGLLSPPSGAAR